ncbi:ankyrin repeat-containing domain protein [Astrocystis sublimbata]|nr:ankyrin repeat-containing domain protein [Astrocystis sublimbata]KAI0198972.1 ankyrin repeat-containing domain protein [Astrocystis sublimbata]KAI0198974.1 ankyrin repeat-containing domain protein [Astrocystis sublimbata]
MDIDIQLPSDATQRRRQQNRIAQRKFRAGCPAIHINSVDAAPLASKPGPASAQGSIALPPTSLYYQHREIPNPPPAESFVPSAMSTLAPSDFMAAPAAPASNPRFAGSGYSDSGMSLDNVDLWDVATIQEFLSQGVKSPQLTTVRQALSPPMSDGHLSATASCNGLSDGPFRDVSRHAMLSSATTTPPPLDSDVSSTRSRSQSNEVSASNPVAPEARWQSALHIAAQNGHERILSALIGRDVDCNEKDSDGRTALVHAVVQDHEAIALVLLGHGARVDETDRQQRSPLHYAVLHQRENMLKLLLQHYKNDPHRFDVNAVDESGWTPLHIAIHKGFEAGVDMLLQCGADIHKKARFCPFTAKVAPHS